MEKTFRFGKIDGYGNGRKTCPAEVEIELKDTADGPEFTASGCVWNPSHTTSIRGGQCLDYIASFVEDPTFQEIYRLWKLYHLNSMRAGSPKQEAFLAERQTSGYEEACGILEKAGLLVDESYVHNGKPYRYGSAWIYSAIPEEDLEKMKRLLTND